MQLPPLNQLLVQDFQGEQSWIGRLLFPLNQLFQSLTNGFNKGITFQDNISCTIYTVNFNNNSSSFPILFKSGISTVPQGLLVINVQDISNAPQALAGAVFPSWTYLSRTSQVNVSSLTGLVSKQQYAVTFLVF